MQADVVKWTRGKGELLEKIFSESDIIRKSEQGRSFMAFWRFLMFSRQQDALRRTLLQVEQAEPLREIVAEHSLADISHEWVQAAAAVQKTLAQLSAQLRRYVDEDYLREERTIYRLIQQIEAQAVDLRGQGPAGEFMEMDDIRAGVSLPMERRLFAPPCRTRLDSPELSAGDGSGGDIAAIFEQVVIDRAKLRRNVEEMLKERPQVTLAEVLAVHPLKQGLSELLAYFVLASKSRDAFGAEKMERILFERDGRKLLAVCEQVSFTRGDFSGV